MTTLTSDPLRIAVIAPPWFEVPPRAYGGIEALCAGLADRLVRRGHDVTLFAAGHDRTTARFRGTYALPPSGRVGESLPEVVHAASVEAQLSELQVDVVHDHSLAGPLAARGRWAPTIVTAHGPVSGEMFDYYRDVGRATTLVAISDAQRAEAPSLNWAARVHNGVTVDDFPFRAEKDDFALFLGRMTPDKGVDLAIDAARAAGRRLLITAKCREPNELAYFEEVVCPRLGGGVEWLGEVNLATRNDLLSRARCLLFPIRWAEPFGLVMVEAMACGTPVVALRRGSVPELVTDGVTGIVCDDAAQLPAAIEHAGHLDPNACRHDAEQRFDVRAMTEAYERVYLQVLDGSAAAPGRDSRRVDAMARDGYAGPALELEAS